MALALLAPALDLPESLIARFAERIPTDIGENAELFKPFFLTDAADSKLTPELRRSIDRLWVLEDMLLFSAEGNPLVAAVYGTATGYFVANVAAKRAFEVSMATQIWPSGLFLNFVRYTLWIGTNKDSALGKWALDRGRVRGSSISLGRALARALARAQDLGLDQDLARTWALDRDKTWALVRARTRALDRDLDYWAQERALDRDWLGVLTTPEIVNRSLLLLCDVLLLKPRVQWWEALRLGFLPNVPQRIDRFDESIWKETENAFAEGTAAETEIYRAAWQLLFDVWLWITEYYKSPDESLFRRLAELTRDVDAPPLQIAHCIRDIAHGDESRIKDLRAMIHSDDPAYREIFERCYWVDAAESR
jgi:hypothetical protein